MLFLPFLFFNFSVHLLKKFIYTTMNQLPLPGWTPNSRRKARQLMVDDTGTALGVRMTPSELQLLLLNQRGTSDEVHVKVLQTKVSMESSSGITET